MRTYHILAVIYALWLTNIELDCAEENNDLELNSSDIHYGEFAPNTTDTPEVETNETESNNLCNTTVCRRRAEYILMMLNDDVSPCDNFYGYVCNNWIFNHPIPDDKTSMSNLAVIDDRTMSNVKVVLENTTYDTENQNIIDKVIIAYHNCVNETISNAKQFQALKDAISSVGGQHWPIYPPPDDQESIPSWEDTYLLVRKNLAASLVLSVSVGKDPENVSDYIINLDPILVRSGVRLNVESLEKKSFRLQSWPT